VSLAALLAGKLRRRQTVFYVLTQLAAGALAALLVRAFVGPATPTVLGSDWKILVGELIFTLALAYVVLNVTSAEDTKSNSFTGLAIGFTVKAPVREPAFLCRIAAVPIGWQRWFFTPAVRRRRSGESVIRVDAPRKRSMRPGMSTSSAP
jgi:hypothetical protein